MDAGLQYDDDDMLAETLGYEIFFYLGVGALDTLAIEVCPKVVRTVYVDRRRFDVEVAVGQEKMYMAYAQFNKDVSRCLFHMNGRHMKLLPTQLPASLVRYCTQAVLGLPLEIMHRAGYLVAELAEKHNMRIMASEGDVKVTKRLRCSRYDNIRWIEVEITVKVAIADPTATIVYAFSDAYVDGCDKRAAPLSDTLQTSDFIV